MKNKNIIMSTLVIMLLTLSTNITSVNAQNTDSLKTQPPITMKGGMWMGMNSKTQFIGFIGPKLSSTFSVSNRIKIEVGLNGIPGLIIPKEGPSKIGMIVGSSITLNKNNSKIKPVLGVMFIKTTTWQPLYGVGFVF